LEQDSPHIIIRFDSRNFGCNVSGFSPFFEQLWGTLVLKMDTIAEITFFFSDDGLYTLLNPPRYFQQTWDHPKIKIYLQDNHIHAFFPQIDAKLDSGHNPRVIRLQKPEFDTQLRLCLTHPQSRYLYNP
jgi:hypothetical protein